MIASLAEATYKLRGQRSTLDINIVTRQKCNRNTQHIGQEGKLGRNTRKRMQGKIRKIKEKYVEGQQKIYKSLITTTRLDGGAGDKIQIRKEHHALRVFLQNPNGLGAQTSNIENQCALHELDKLGTDIIALPETKVNWENPHEVDKWKNLIRQKWPKAKILTACTPTGDRTASTRPRGVCMAIRCKFASMVTASGKDKKGRWVWATITGSKENTTIITCYRPCKDTVDTAGESSQWMQLYNRQLQELDASNAAADEYNNVDPRDIMNRDLDGFIAGEQDKGHRIILLGDMNQDLSSRQRTKLTFGELCKRRKL